MAAALELEVNGSQDEYHKQVNSLAQRHVEDKEVSYWLIGLQLWYYVCSIIRCTRRIEKTEQIRYRS